MSRALLARGVVLGLVLVGCRAVPETRPGEVSEYVRALALPAVGPAGNPWRELPGRVVLVSFFATWCFPCVAEMPTLESLQREYGPRGLQVVAVGMDLEGARVLAPFAEHYALPYAVLVADERMMAGQSAYGPIQALPTSFLLDREGRVVAAWQGVAAHAELVRAIQTLLKP